jgi:predicted ribosomally synthesized peptide with SipW-like signal peptide
VSTTKKVLRTVVVLGLIGAFAAVGAFSAFSSQTENPDNQITAGTVDLSDNDSGNALYNLTNAKPNDPQQRCIEVSYTGSLASEVKMYRVPGAALGSLATNVTVTVQSGTQATPSFPGCTGFTAEDTLYTGKLNALPTDWNTGLLDAPGSDGDWDQNEKLVYRVTVSVDDVPAAEGQSTGAHTLRWEARNL